jgi:hypothetical protein
LSRLNIILVLGIAAIICGCAQVVAPTGGAKDTQPPVVTKEVPSNAKAGFNSNKIVVGFDEYIQLISPEEQIVISPPLEEKPEYEISGKNLIIRFRSAPKPNTTYTINFGNSLADNHEGNVLGDYRYVFSTGSTIDTLNISGKIVWAENNEPKKNMNVCLYPINGFSDSSIYLTKPAYFAKSKEAGFFRLYNLPDKKFRLIAFADDNKNLKYDKNEAIAFVNNPVLTSDTSTRYELKMYQPDLYEAGKIIDTFSREENRFTFLIYKPSGVLPIPLNKSVFFLRKMVGKSDIDSVFIYTGPKEKDSLCFTYNTDFVCVKTKKSTKKPSLYLDMQKNVELNDTVTISLSNPCFNIDTSKLVLIEDTLNQAYKYIIDTSYFVIKIIYKWKENTKYTLQVKDSCFKDIYNQYSKKQSINWVSKNLKSYSTLMAKFIYYGNNQNLLIQLISADEKKVYKSFYLNNQSEYFFDYLLPGTYKLKVIDDRNRNGKWDNGNFIMQQQPENVFYFPEIFNLRAFWDLEQQFDLNNLIK